MSKQFLFILFLKDEIDTDCIISLSNEFHILTYLLLIVFFIILLKYCITFKFILVLFVLLYTLIYN